MKTLDFTPNRGADGKISLPGMLQGVLKYGLSYPRMLKAQEFVRDRLQKGLGSRFVLLRNLVLPKSDILVPLILVGPPGVFVIQPLDQEGVFEARGAEWGRLEKGGFKPASVNWLKRTATLARAVQVYLARQGYEFEKIEGVLMAGAPSLHIESDRPIVRVLMADAIDRFALSLRQARPVLSEADVRRIVERFQNPRSKTEESARIAEAQLEPGAVEEADVPALDVLADGFGFTPADEPASSPPQPEVEAAAPSRAAAQPSPEPRWPLGLSTRQFLLLLGMFLVEVFILIGFMIVYLINQ